MLIKAGSAGIELRSEMRGGKGKIEINHIMKEGLPAKCRMLAEIKVNPGCSIGYHTHEGETEIYIVRSGVALLDDNGKKITAYPGDSLPTPNGCGHSVEAVGDEPLILMAVIILD